MNANKLATLVNGHVAANLPHRCKTQCSITPVNRRLSTLMLPSFYKQQPTTLEAEMIAELNAENGE